MYGFIACDCPYYSYCVLGEAKVNPWLPSIVSSMLWHAIRMYVGAYKRQLCSAIAHSEQRCVWLINVAVNVFDLLLLQEEEELKSLQHS